jgi:hypothetical protein
MSPLPFSEVVAFSVLERRKVVEKPTDPNGLIVEAWSQGYLVGSLIIMGFITMANMRRGVLLHKVRAGADLPKNVVLMHLLAYSPRGTTHT